MSAPSSISDSDSDVERNKIEDIVLEEPSFYVLSQFFETENNKNITMVLQELTSELRDIKNLLAQYFTK